MLKSLVDIRKRNSLQDLCAEARSMRDQSKGRIVSFSPKVFIPLTRLCRDFCSYCVFRQSPQQAESLYMSPEEVLEVARAGQEAGCREALFVLGERPEQRYPEARKWLEDQGFTSTIHYLRAMCELVLEETRLFPHSNPGTMTERELQILRPVNVSMGLMLESTSEHLYQPGGPHEHAPSKHPRARLRTLELAGELQIPFTTGLLVGIGETVQDRIDALEAIQDLQQRFGHIQEVIIQNFCAKPDTPMEQSSEATREEMLETVALARILLGPEMNVQVPPNLTSPYWIYLEAGINDWGGISPVTRDYVNPEACWPQIVKLQQVMKDRGYQLRARYPVYPEYFMERSDFIEPELVKRLRQEADPEGYFDKHDWNGSPLSGAITSDSHGEFRL
jgi:FO synthase